MLSKTSAKLGNVLIGRNDVTEGCVGCDHTTLAKKLPFLKVSCFLLIQSDGKTIGNGD